MFDVNFYNKTALANFIIAAQSVVDDFTPAVRCEDFYWQETYARIRDIAVSAVDAAMPVQIEFDQDLRDDIDGLITFHGLESVEID